MNIEISSKNEWIEKKKDEWEILLDAFSCEKFNQNYCVYMCLTLEISIKAMCFN